MSLLGKKVLFFAPNSFGYEYEIKNELERQGAIVTLHDERPSNATFVKAIIRLNKKLVRFYTDNYFDSILKKYANTYFDFVFVLRGEAFSPLVIKKFRAQFPKTSFILYLWDSIKNNNTLDIIPLFDRVYSFDRRDTLKYSTLSFLPLFYLREYAELNTYSNDGPNKIMFVGTVHSDRYLLIEKLKQALRHQEVCIDTYYFFQSKLLYLRKRLLDASFRKTSMNDFRFISLAKEEIVDKVKRSKAVLDIQHPRQIGLTMRSIETLGGNRKLITTNCDIVNYDFYTPSNILVLDRNDSTEQIAEAIQEFMITPYQVINQQVYERYSITSWTNQIFSF